MTCKCKARTYTGHLKRVAGGYPGHTYTGNAYKIPNLKTMSMKDLDATLDAMRDSGQLDPEWWRM